MCDGGQTLLDSLELGLWAVVSCWVWVVGTRLGSFGRATGALSSRASLQTCPWVSTEWSYHWMSWVQVLFIHGFIYVHTCHSAQVEVREWALLARPPSCRPRYRFFYAVCALQMFSPLCGDLHSWHCGSQTGRCYIGKAHVSALQWVVLELLSPADWGYGEFPVFCLGCW